MVGILKPAGRGACWISALNEEIEVDWAASVFLADNFSSLALSSFISSLIREKIDNSFLFLELTEVRLTSRCVRISSRDDYNTTADYRCLDEITTKAKQVKRLEPGSSSSSFKIKAEILKTSSSPLEVVWSILDVQDQGWIFEFLIEPTQNRSRIDRF